MAQKAERTIDAAKRHMVDELPGMMSQVRDEFVAFSDFLEQAT
jgi:hypothetical protein